VVTIRSIWECGSDEYQHLTEDGAMKLEIQKDVAAARTHALRNPFGVMDVPDPNAHDVMSFAAETNLTGSADDVNAHAWGAAGAAKNRTSIAGEWSSRWNGGVDSTIPEDSKDKWKLGRGELRIVGDRVYILFDWNDGARKGLIDARWENGNRLVGKYINLGNPEIMRPWVGLIVNNDRIDGKFSAGRLDFRR
jgi:hypothetical protein